MNQINLIITTKFYPCHNDNGIVWTDFKLLPIKKGLSFNSEMVDQNYEFTSIKNRCIPDNENKKSYDIYVVPCTINTELSKRLSYLNNVVEVIITDADTDTLKNTFLIAHEKDFIDEIRDCFVLSRIDRISEYPYLEKLLDVRHIFLFSHDGKLKSELNRIPHTEDDVLNFDSCEFLHNMADAHSRMIQHFNDINGVNHDKDKTQNLYPIQ